MSRPDNLHEPTGKDEIRVWPVPVGATGSFNEIKDLLTVFERSIRPIRVTKLEITGSNSKLQTTINAKTYYQPGKTINFQKKVVK
jgi:hypothetical protein